MQKNKLSIAVLSITAAAALALTGCSGAQNAATSTPTVAPTSTSVDQPDHTGLAVSDAWVKAAEAKGGEHAGMTAFFVTIENHGTEGRTIVKAATEVAGMVQLHTTVKTAGGGTEMKEKDGGFELAPGAKMSLEPGADHVMLMGLKRDLKAGDTVRVTLTLDNGDEIAVSAPVKAFAGAKESYAPSGEASTPEASDSEHSGHGASSTGH